jgi:spore germination protein YaaH
MDELNSFYKLTSPYIGIILILSLIVLVFIFKNNNEVLLIDKDGKQVKNERLLSYIITDNEPDDVSIREINNEPDSSSQIIKPKLDDFLKDKEFQFAPLDIMSVASEDMKILGWIPYWDQQNAFESFKKNIEVFDYLGLFWYQLDSEGSIRPYSTTFEAGNIIEFAHQNNVKVLPVIANLPNYMEGGDWDWRRVDRVISSSKKRAAHIEDIIKLLVSNNFDGVNIDYEALKANQKDNFTVFIQELSEALHAEGKILGIAIHPKTSEDNPREANGSQAQDWRELHPVVDHMYLMTYSQHWLGSEPGPNASISWIEGILNYAVNVVKIPAEKIFFGIPFYGHEWHEGSRGSFSGVDDDVSYRHATALINRYDVDVIWDEVSQTPYFEYFQHNQNHIVWFENKESFEAKLNLTSKYNLANLAFWRLGGEDPAIWQILQEY